MLFCNVSSSLAAAEFDITRFGATPDDKSDDTAAIEDALTACGRAGGGTVFVPTGTFILSRRNSETPILEMPPNPTLRGEGTSSILKFATDVNKPWLAMPLTEYKWITNTTTS